MAISLIQENIIETEIREFVAKKKFPPEYNRVFCKMVGEFIGSGVATHSELAQQMIAANATLTGAAIDSFYKRCMVTRQ